MHKDLVRKAAGVFRALSNPLRLEIMLRLVERPHRVHELVELFGASQPLVSQHLRVLRQAKLLTTRRSGRETVYSVADSHVHRILTDAVEHATQTGTDHDPPDAPPEGGGSSSGGDETA